ncbi:MAG: Ig-like domain-containing protein [Bacteroidales bacterium]|nr:Ig-like domain-containing protein [Bacteroidales bacterium]
MKRIKNKILLIIVVLSGYLIQAQPIQMTIPDDATHTVGDVIIIPVNVDNSLTVFDVLSYQFRIYFNSARLSFNSIDVVGTMSDAWGTPIYNNSEPNYINIANAGTTALTGTGTLFNLNFTCITSGVTWINFDGDEVNNFFNEGYPPMLYDDGYITISALPTISIYPDVGLLSVGEELQFSVSGGADPYTWEVTDPAVASIVSNGPTTGMLTALSQGLTKVNVEDDNGITDETTGFVEVRAMKLTIPDTSEWQGGFIEIPIYTTSLDGLGIMSGEMNFTFNGNILTPTGYNTTGTLLDGYSNFAFNNTIAGALSISFAGTTPLSGSGVLFYIQFDISAINSGPTWINFGEALSNESIPAKTVDGYFTMITFGTIYITPNTYTIVAGETKQFVASGGVPPYNTWSSSDPTVASIDGAGILSAHKSGVIQITVIDDVGATGTSGNIDVYDTYVSLPHVNGSLGTLYDMPVLISTLPLGQSVQAIQGSISFESPELEAIEIIEAGTMTDGWNFAYVVTGNTINFAGAGITSFNTPGVMFMVRFQLTPDLTNGENAWVNINNITLNEGIPLPLTVNGSITGTAGVIVSLDAFLEGPFDVTDMSTDLNPSFIPNNQPYNVAPWSYAGTESVGAVPNGDVTDWVLVELRETAGGAATAIPGNRIARQAGFLLRDGSIVSTDGISNMIFGVGITNNLYVVLWHRNHLGIMSAIPLTLGGGIYSYDFSTAASQAYLSGQINLGGGNYGMYAGDADGNGEVHQDDIDIRWSNEVGGGGYFGGDMNMNSQVNNQDKNDIWLPNNTISDQIPD